MQYFIFIGYLFLFCYLVSRIHFLYQPVGKVVIVVLYLVKVIAGIAYAAFYSLPKYYPGSDTWRFYRLSLPETQWLLTDPVAFFKDLFVFGYSAPGNLFSGSNSYWNDLKSNVVVKLMAITNAFTHNSYYTNILFFNFFFLVGLVALYRLLLQQYPEKKWLLVIAVFLLPSTLFWCSGIHKDGLLLSAAGLSFYLFDKQLKAGVTLKKTLALLACLLIIFALRNYVLFALLPAFLAYALAEKFPRKRTIVHVAINGFGIVFFFGAVYLNPSLDFAAYLVAKRNEFFLLEANSTVYNTTLVATFVSFLRFMPYAFDMAFLQPHLNSLSNFAYLPAAVETLLLLLLVLLTTLSFSKKKSRKLAALIIFGVSILLVCGYTVPFVGAIVRYRSIALPFIFGPLLGIINPALLRSRVKQIWQKLKKG